MKCRDLSRIIIPRNHRRASTLEKPIAGLDTETYKGKVFVIAINTKDGCQVKRIRTWNDVFSFIMFFKNYDVFAWNAGYDSRAIIMHLPINNRRELLTVKQTRLLDGTAIKYIPDKLLIVTKGKNKFRLWDASQFFDHTSLREAARMVNLSKGSEVDVAILDPKRYDSDKEYHKLVDTYIIMDAQICYELASLLIMVCGEYRPSVWYSQASIAESYKDIMVGPTIRPPRPVMQAALNAYSGGRFEVFRRGRVSNTSIYDIRSAYPEAMVSIPSTGHGRWIHAVHDDPKALIRLLKVKVTYNGYIGLLPVDRGGSVFYPNGTVTRWVVGEEIDVIKSTDAHIKYIESYLYYDDSPVYPWNYLRDIFELKESCKKNNPLRMLYKIILNGTYGKTIQVSPIDEDGDLSIEEACREVYLDCEGRLKKRVVKNYKAGRMFDPVTAALVTGRTRAKILRCALESPDDVVAIATDSIAITNNNKPSSISLGKKLGDWSMDANNRTMYIISSGLYWLDGDSTMKARGISKKYPVSTISSDTDVVKVTAKRVIRSAAALKGHSIITTEGELTLSPSDENRFVEIVKGIKLNSDIKRNWEDTFTSTTDFMGRSIKSKPITGNYTQ